MAWRDAQGATAVEFALTLPVFAALIFGVIQVGLLLWTQLGIQNGVEAAARCASVNTTICPDAGSIQNYAAQHALGLGLPASTFSVVTQACGNQVSANYTMALFTNSFPSASLTLTAQSCFPS
jgi:Flp pilus assembly protein TadG